ncbi:MAG: hypothetical protein ABSH53_07690 [Holophaga sp.]|jgi:drug/metabolite transporter (DMT)-like permease
MIPKAGFQHAPDLPVGNTEVAAKTIQAQTIALLRYLDPMVSVAISLLVFSETLAPLQTLGACCICGSILYATLVPLSRSVPAEAR